LESFGVSKDRFVQFQAILGYFKALFKAIWGCFGITLSHSRVVLSHTRVVYARFGTALDCTKVVSGQIGTIIGCCEAALVPCWPVSVITGSC
jgi:hypothetical protein